MTSSHELSSWRGRAWTFYTIPHALFLVSLIALTVYIAATMRVETSRRQKAHRLTQRCAFVYLAPANYTHIHNLGSSLQSLNRYVRFDTKYKILILHDHIPPVVQGRLQAVSEAPLHFRYVSIQSPMNQTDLLANLTRAEARKVTYKNFFRFWFFTAMLNDQGKSPFVSDFDYIVRLDHNWAFVAPVKTDFLQDFVQSGAQYGYQKVTKECAVNSTTTLRELVTSYVDMNGITPRSASLWSAIVESPHVQCMPKFETHFEAINLRFFRSHSGIQHWLRAVEANGGIYTNGWRDDVLRYVTIALYAVREKVVQYPADVIPYQKL